MLRAPKFHVDRARLQSLLHQHMASIGSSLLENGIVLFVLSPTPRLDLFLSAFSIAPIYAFSNAAGSLTPGAFDVCFALLFPVSSTVLSR